MKEKNRTFETISEYYAGHRDELLGYVERQLQYAAIAEDIVQDVFLRLLRSDKMITPVTLPGLVHTITRRLIYDYWRRRRSAEEFEHYLASHPQTQANDVASVYSSAEMHQLLERGIVRLSERQRQVYSMNVFEGMKVKEISEALQMNYKSVENHLGAARREMRTYVARMLA
ncbi:MAG: RNA polymerase sigma factor [Prevotella sp.]|nr:RNA polymerase sigma factor [Prevotella sp.]